MKKTVVTKVHRSGAAEYLPAKRRANLTPGMALKTVRELQAMTQRQLADASGLDQSVISALENGRANIGVDRARKLARALRVHPAVLVFADWPNDADSSPHEQPARAVLGRGRGGHGKSTFRRDEVA